MGNLLTLKYWFDVYPGELSSRGQYLLLAFLALLLAATIIAKVYKKRYKRGLYYKFISRIATYSLSNFMIGIMLMFFAFEAVPFLSTRILFFAWLVEMIVWKVYILKDLKKIPEIKEKIAQEQEFRKYIP